jgi:DNA repair ATPase RecN
MLGFTKRKSVECAANVPEGVEYAIKPTEKSLDSKLSALKEHFKKVEAEAHQYIETEYPRFESQISTLKMVLHREMENKYDHYDHLEPSQIVECEQRIAALEKTQNEQRPKLKKAKELRNNARRYLRDLNVDFNAKINFANSLKRDVDRARDQARQAARIAENLEQRWQVATRELENQVNEIMDHESIER